MFARSSLVLGGAGAVAAGGAGNDRKGSIVSTAGGDGRNKYRPGCLGRRSWTGQGLLRAQWGSRGQIVRTAVQEGVGPARSRRVGGTHAVALSLADGRHPPQEDRAFAYRQFVRRRALRSMRRHRRQQFHGGAASLRAPGSDATATALKQFGLLRPWGVRMLAVFWPVLWPSH